jgi:hypothetical protein
MMGSHLDPEQMTMTEKIEKDQKFPGRERNYSERGSIDVRYSSVDTYRNKKYQIRNCSVKEHQESVFLGRSLNTMHT